MIDLNFTFIAGYSLLAFAAWSLVRGRYAALTMMSVALVGLGETPLPFVGYAVTLMGVQAMAIGAVLARVPARRGRSTLNAIYAVPWPLQLLIGISAIIAAKDVAGCIFGGLEAIWVRDAALTATTSVLLPVALLGVCFIHQPWRAVLDHFMGGALISSLIWIGFGWAGQWSVDAREIIFNSEGRLVFHNRDTITSVRLLPWMFAAVVYFAMKKHPSGAGRLALVLLPVMVATLLLNGTRQVTLAMVIFASLMLILGHGGRRTAIAISAVAVTSAILFLWSPDSNRALAQRLTTDGAATDGRWAYWSAAYDFTREHPWTGGGFRSFGDTIETVDPETLRVSQGKDYAHGIVMDTLTDHGFPITIMLIAVLGLAIMESAVVAAACHDRDIRIVCVMFVSFPVTLLFSGMHWNATMLFVPAVLCAGARAGRWGEAGRFRKRSPANDTVHGEASESPDSAGSSVNP